MHKYINNTNGDYRPHVLSGAHGFRPIGTRFTNHKEPSFTPFDCYGIWIIKSGRVEIINNENKRQVLLSPQIIILLPGTELQLILPQAKDYSWLQFGVRNWPLIPRRKGGWKYYLEKERPKHLIQPQPKDVWGIDLPTTLPASLYLYSLNKITQILSDWWRDDLGRANADAILSQWLITIIRRLNSEEKHLNLQSFYKEKDKFEIQAIEVLQTNMKDIITVNHWAQLLGITTQTFRTYCSKSVGIKPKSWMTDLKITYAMELLNHGDKAIDSISLECGFSSRESFTRCFKQQTGLPPNDWIKQQFKNSTN